MRVVTTVYCSKEDSKERKQEISLENGTPFT